MMKKFILMVCGSFVGASIALIVFGLCAMVMSFGIFFSMKKTQPIKKNSILCINLEGEIAEHSTLQPIDVIDLLEGKQQPSSLDNIVKALDVAKTNSKITAVLIDCQGADASAATLHTIRNAVADFKTCGKPVLAYAREGYSQGDYFVASAADKIYLNPVGMVDLHGLASFTPYFKKLLKNVGVEMQVVKVGTYKSAVEPFMIDSISPANREQQELYLKNIWGTMSAEIAADRHIPLAKLDSITNTILITQNAEELVNLKLVDELCYEPDFTTTLLDLCRLEDKDDLYFVYPEDVAVKYDYGKNKDGIVAVVYACGEIDGAEEGGIQSDDLVNILDELKDDEDIRGMVLRVNSPGGSAFGSEQIWKAVEDFKLTGKTVAVSMGDYAASGGYYISCGAHRIFADSTTLTGSIGIFGLIPCAQELMENKLGVTMSVVKTHSNADMAAAGIMSKKLSPTQLAAMQKYVENGYELFTSRVAQGRSMNQDSVKAIAEGRVWDAKKALEIKLIDEIGGLNQAVKWVAQTSMMREGRYKIKEYTGVEEPSLAQLLTMKANSQYKKELQQSMGMFYTYYEQLKALTSRNHVLCLMPQAEIK